MSEVIFRPLVQQNYLQAWEAMKDFTASRDEKTPDEIWFIEHPPVYTLGQNGKMEHVLNPGQIPVIPVDRGGQVTYHGPGQLMMYCLLNLKRRNLSVRGLVCLIEKSVISLLKGYGILACNKPDAPGIYVNEAKIGSLGLRVRRGYSYHGLALNVNMDLTPFQGINPCGFKNLAMTQIVDLDGPGDLRRVAYDLENIVIEQLN